MFHIVTLKDLFESASDVLYGNLICWKLADWTNSTIFTTSCFKKNKLVTSHCKTVHTHNWVLLFYNILCNSQQRSLNVKPCEYVLNLLFESYMMQTVNPWVCVHIANCTAAVLSLFVSMNWSKHPVHNLSVSASKWGVPHHKRSEIRDRKEMIPIKIPSPHSIVINHKSSFHSTSTSQQCLISFSSKHCSFWLFFFLFSAFVFRPVVWNYQDPFHKFI